MSTLRNGLMMASLVCGVGTSASAAVAVLQDVDSSANAPSFLFNGNAVTHAEFDDGQFVIADTANATNAGGNSSIQMRTVGNGVVQAGLLAIDDLFTLVPGTSGGDNIQINSATLFLAGGGDYSTSGFSLNISRVTTDWLAQAPGVNQNFFAGTKRNGTTKSGSTVTDGASWLNDGVTAGKFGTADYSTDDAVSAAAFAPAAYGNYVGFDVTEMLKDIYATGNNQGFFIEVANTGSTFVVVRSSEDTLLVGSGETFRPALQIDFEYVPEPASLALVAAGGLMMIGRRRRA